jgi:NADH-quinone oxidoreductase subunit G
LKQNAQESNQEPDAMSTIDIDGKPYSVRPGQDLLSACLALGIDLPYFCWHPALGSVGSCRQCAVKQFKDADDDQGKLVMACMTPAEDGTRISVTDPEAEALRRGVIEWMMTNHPHDCPVCEEGGECHLQDMTLMSGHVYRRDRFPKRTFRNQDLGPLLGHEMNRCITCYRCVRFYNDYAGGKDLMALGIGHQVYFGREADGVLESPFSGNLVEVCPTGVFTDKPFSRRYIRKWDLMSTPSLCPHCAAGCNTQPAVRAGDPQDGVRRVVNRYNDAVNSYFLCDRGRYGHGYTEHLQRVLRVQRRGDDGQRYEVTAQAAIRALGQRAGVGRVIGIGSPRASLEANLLLRALVGPERFFAGLADADHQLSELALSILRDGPVPAADRADLEAADCVLVLGEDVGNTAPRLALSIRQATRNRARVVAAWAMVEPWKEIAVEHASRGLRSPLFVLTPDHTLLDAVAASALHAPPQTIARIGFAIAQRLGADLPAVDGLSDDEAALAEHIGDALRQAKRPLIVSGTGCGAAAVLQAAANVAWALWSEPARSQGDRAGAERQVRLRLVQPECNSLGLALLEAPPLSAAFAALATGTADTLLVLENDLYRRAPAPVIDAALDGAAEVWVLDHLHHAMAERAHGLLPAAPLTETDATLVNDEGRAQRAYRVLPATGAARESWRWLLGLIDAAGIGLPGVDPEASSEQHAPDPVFAAVSRALAEAYPGLASMIGCAPDTSGAATDLHIPRATPRASSRTALDADRQIHEPPPPPDPDSPFVFSMEGGARPVPDGLAPWYLAPGWSSNEALHRFQQEIPGPLRDAWPGVRLITPAIRPPVYFRGAPRAFAPRPDAWLVLPLHRVFGSEELSARSAPIIARSTPPWLTLSPRDAERLGVSDGGQVELLLDGELHRLPMRIEPGLTDGTAGLPLGMPGLTGLRLPAWGEIRVPTAWQRDPDT